MATVHRRTPGGGDMVALAQSALELQDALGHPDLPPTGTPRNALLTVRELTY